MEFSLALGMEFSLPLTPYTSKLKKQITIRLDESTIDYFKILSEKNDIPYQTLINLYLKDCADKHKSLDIKWK